MLTGPLNDTLKRETVPAVIVEGKVPWQTPYIFIVVLPLPLNAGPICVILNVAASLGKPILLDTSPGSGKISCHTLASGRCKCSGIERCTFYVIKKVA